MFLLYASPGAVLPLFSLRLQELGFSPLEIGLACATQALAALVGPILAGQLADRWFPAQRCLSFLLLCASLPLASLADQTQPVAVFLTSLAFWLFMGPAVTIGTSVSLAHLSSPERHFGSVRLWGTLGWAASGWTLGYWFHNPDWCCRWLSYLRPGAPHSQTADMFRLGAIFALMASIYAWSLPHTPPGRSRQASFAPLAALHLLRGRAFAVYAAVVVAVAATVALNTQTTPLLLERLGVERARLVPLLTISQSLEVLSLAILPLLLRRLGIRRTLLLGLGAWCLALTGLTVGGPVWLVVGSLTPYGLCICCVFVAGQVFVNRQASGDIRTSAQGLLTFLSGVGMLLGSLLAGAARALADGQLTPTFAAGALLAAGAALALKLGFTDKRPAPVPLAEEVLST
jgi:predicted MFS family arabinose efflux permease